MTGEQITNILKSYRQDKARQAYLCARIARLNIEIRRATAALAGDVSSLQAQQITGMPHGTTVGNPTERLGIMLADGYETDEIRIMRGERELISAEYDEVTVRVSTADALLSALSERERWVVERHVIDAESWAAIAEMYRAKYGYEVSVATLRRLNKTGYRAMSKASA